MADKIHTAKGLQRLLEVRSYIDFGQTNSMAEKILYKDWGRETEVHFDIIQQGNAGLARRQWVRLGTTPWAWRYSPLTDEGIRPHFTFLLNRSAKLTVQAFDRNGKTFPFPPDKFDSAKFSDIFVRQKEVGSLELITRRCVPVVSVMRPQTAFLPISARPDQLFELGTTALLYYPRDSRTRDGAVLTEPLKGSSDKQVKKQIRNRYSSKRNPRTDTGKGSEYVITSSANGHVIASVDGEYLFEIAINDMHEPAEYNFELTSKEFEGVRSDGNEVRFRNWDEIELYVHHGPNVTVTARAKTKPFVLESHVRVLEENVGGHVAPLGDALPDKSRFRALDPPDRSGLQFLYIIGSMALVLVPGVGWLAALALTAGELVHAYHTGKDFFGQKVSPTEFAALGVLGIAGTVGDVLGLLRLRRATMAITHEIDTAFRSAFNQLAHEYDAALRGSFEAVERAGDHPLAKLVASLPPDKQAVLADLGLLSIGPAEYLDAAGKLLSEHLATLNKSNAKEFQLIVVSILEGILTPDGTTFCSDYLRALYEVYKRNPKTKKIRDPITWMRLSKSKRVSAFLKSAMGDRYRQIIRAAQEVDKGKVVVMATEQNIHQAVEFFDALSRLGLTRYEDLENLRKLSKYNDVRGLLKDCFQFEHPLELRFARNLDGKQHFKRTDSKGRIRWAIDPKPLGIDVEAEFLAIIVPRTRRHAALLQGADLSPKTALRYTQHPKTKMVADRIPHGAEHLAEPQEIADAICTALLQVNFDQLGNGVAAAKDLMARLDVDFQRMTDFINEVRKPSKPYAYPVTITDLADINPALLPGGKGWPRFEKDKRGVWSITNKAEVEEARRARGDWAAEKRGG